MVPGTQNRTVVAKKDPRTQGSGASLSRISSLILDSRAMSVSCMRGSPGVTRSLSAVENWQPWTSSLCSKCDGVLASGLPSGAWGKGSPPLTPMPAQSFWGFTLTGQGCVTSPGRQVPLLIGLFQHETPGEILISWDHHLNIPMAEGRAQVSGEYLHTGRDFYKLTYSHLIFKQLKT